MAAQKMVLIPERELQILKEKNDEKETVIYKPNDVEIRIEKEQDKPMPILEMLPPRLKKRAQRILLHIKQHPEMIQVMPDGRLSINQHEVAGANIIDILNEILVSIRRKKFSPPGITDFMRVLAFTHFPETGITNPRRRKELQKYRRAMPNRKKKTNAVKRYY